MPLGAFRLNSLARYVAAIVAGRPATITAYGNAQVDTEYSKFGGGSLLTLNTSDGYLEITDTDYFDLSEYNDFTVEFWVRPSNTTAGNRLLNHAEEGTNNGWYCRLSNLNSNNYVQWISYNGSTNFTRQTSTQAVVYNAWNHIAFVRSGTSFKIYGNGVEKYSATDFVDVPGPSSASLLINGSVQSGTPYGARTSLTGNGYPMDEIRVSNVARYTSTFVPPTQRFVSDENTLLLIHCDGTDGSTTFTDDTDSTALASWQDWSTSKMGSLLENDADTSYITSRGLEGISFVSDDKFYALYSNPSTPFSYEGYHAYSRSGTTLTFDGRTEVTGANWGVNYTNAQNFTLESFNKFVMMSGSTQYIVCTYSNGNISVPTSYTGTITSITSAADSQYHVHPADDTKIIQHDIDGDMQLLAFNNSTNTLSVTTNTTIQGNKVSTATNAYGFWTLTSGTYKFALVYWDTTNTTWKVRHYAADLTSYTDTTLNNTPAFSNTQRSFGNFRQPINKALCVVRDTTNNVMPSFIVSWNGSSFTQNATTNITTSDSTYVDPSWMSGVYYLEDGVWAVNTLMNDEGGDAYLDHKTFILNADGSNNVGKLGEIKMNLANTNSNGHVRTGISLGPSKDYAVLWGDDLTNGVTARLIWRT